MQVVATTEVTLNLNAWIRQIHRWLSIAFTLAVILNIAAWGQKEPPIWVGVLALIPLGFLLLSGLYLFALPYLNKQRNTRPT